MQANNAKVEDHSRLAKALFKIGLSIGKDTGLHLNQYIQLKQPRIDRGLQEAGSAKYNDNISSITLIKSTEEKKSEVSIKKAKDSVKQAGNSPDCNKRVRK